MAKRKPKFEVIDGNETELCSKKKFTEHDIISYQPANPRQSKFIDLYHSNSPCILLEGYPGTGKTFLALIEALRQVVDQSTHYEKLIYIRSAVPSGQDVGYLKGDLAEKQAPFEEVPQQMFSKITKYNDPYKNLVALGYVEFRLDTHLRGINIENAIVVVDEAQCMDYSSLRTILTRLDSGSRVIICGDEKQDDLKRKKKRSGLSHLKTVLSNMPYDSYGHVAFRLEDIVRGDDFTKNFIIADFETDED